MTTPPSIDPGNEVNTDPAKTSVRDVSSNGAQPAGIRKNGNTSHKMVSFNAGEYLPSDDMTMTVALIQATNVERANRWHGGDFREWSVLEWAGALCGEAGELANVAKKIRRIETGTAGNAWSDRPLEMDALEKQFAGECADVFLYLTLCASRMGVNLASAIREKFNAKSEQMGFPERL